MATEFERQTLPLLLVAASDNVVLDPILLSALTDLLSAMAASLAPGTYSTLVGEAFPPLVAIIMDPAESSGQVWLASSALELIVSVLEGGEKGNLGEGFVAALAPPLFECLTRTQDRDVIVVSDPFWHDFEHTCSQVHI